MPTTTKTQSTWSAQVTAEAKASWTAWTPEVWQPLGIKDRTATKRADKDGKGGTRPAMLAVMVRGIKDPAFAAQVAACIRHTYLGCKATDTNGILFSWFASIANMATVASNATFGPQKDGTMRLVRKQAVKASKPKAPKPAAADSANGPVVVVRPSDKALAEAAA